MFLPKKILKGEACLRIPSFSLVFIVYTMAKSICQIDLAIV
jgi:hypothetical protein